MNDLAQDPLEQELRRLRPAQPPTELMDRLRATCPPAGTAAGPEPPRGVASRDWMKVLLRVLAPVSAAAVLVAAGMVLHGRKPAAPPGAEGLSPVIADDVTVASELVSSFDAVAELPGGEPVRVRCRQWVDHVVVRIGGKEVTIEQRKPRMEVVPVRFETY